MYRRFSLGLSLAVALAGCETAGQDRVLAISAMGRLSGLVYFDANGNRAPDGTDSPLGDIRVQLVAAGTRDTVASAVSDETGRYAFLALVVGSYTVGVDPASVGDTVRVVRIDTSHVVIQPDDSVFVRIAVSYPKVSVAQARGLVPGSRVFVDAIALTPRDAFGDTTLHVADATGAIRATRVKRALILTGDSLRLLGTRSSRNGQATLDDVTPLLLAISAPPPAAVMTTGLAASADAGRADAALVAVRSARIEDTTTTTEGFVLRVDDGSGPLDVLLDGDTGLSTAPYVPGAVIDATGVLVASGGGGWWLKPRRNADLALR